MVEIMSQMNDQEILKLPKNIRQIGLPEEKKKIYVEDYVVTYMNQLAADYPNQQVAAILLGNYVKQKDARLTFIHGAIGIPVAKVEDDRIAFDTNLWESIYDTIRKFFNNGEIVGWFLTRPGRTLGVNEKITKIHVDHFPGREKTLFMMDPLDKEEAFFLYEGGKLTRQQGYYIYYERNEEMQNYMVEQRKDKSDEEHLEAAGFERASRLQRNERSKHRGSVKHESRTYGKKIAGTIVAALLLIVVGMNVMEKFYAPEASVLTLNDQIQEQEETMTIKIPEHTAVQETEAEDVSSTFEPYILYTVRKGDTLVNLSIGLYDTMDYVDVICELNDIDDPDLIYEGMVLSLPEKR